MGAVTVSTLCCCCASFGSCLKFRTRQRCHRDPAFIGRLPGPGVFVGIGQYHGRQHDRSVCAQRPRPRDLATATDSRGRPARRYLAGSGGTADGRRRWAEAHQRGLCRRPLPGSVGAPGTMAATASPCLHVWRGCPGRSCGDIWLLVRHLAASLWKSTLPAVQCLVRRAAGGANRDWRYAMAAEKRCGKPCCSPLLWSPTPVVSAELPMRPFIWPVLWVLMVLWVGSAALRKSSLRLSASERLVVLFVSLAFPIWMALFSIYRFSVSMEMLAPLVVWLVAHQLLRRHRKTICCVNARSSGRYPIATVHFWDHSAWDTQAFRVVVPPLPASGTILLIKSETPNGWMAPFFPPTWRWSA